MVSCSGIDDVIAGAELEFLLEVEEPLPWCFVMTAAQSSDGG